MFVLDMGWVFGGFGSNALLVVVVVVPAATVVVVTLVVVVGAAPAGENMGDGGAYA